MSFGQPSGPPASQKQIQTLLELLQGAGHADFRDARGPMGFNQRQAAGRFTRDEAAAFIERLEDGEQSGESESNEVNGLGTVTSAVDVPKALLDQRPPLSAQERALQRVPAEQLAHELERRGWLVVAPLTGDA